MWEALQFVMEEPNGELQASTDLHWPNVLCPPKPHFTAFLELLWLIFCTFAPTHQPAHFSMKLDTPLEKMAVSAREDLVPLLPNFRTPLMERQGGKIFRIDDFRVTGFTTGCRKSQWSQQSPIQLSLNKWTWKFGRGGLFYLKIQGNQMIPLQDT